MLPSAKTLVSNPKLYSSGFGLFDKSLKGPLPLMKLDISVSIFESTAKVAFSQTYQNTSDSLLETEYLFPVPIDARFDSFQAKYENIVVEGVIKEKRTAEEEYKKNLEKGNTVAYAEVLKSNSDVMKVLIGNQAIHSNFCDIFLHSKTRSCSKSLLSFRVLRNSWSQIQLAERHETRKAIE